MIDENKVIGVFAYRDDESFCSSGFCIIASDKEMMRIYIKESGVTDKFYFRIRKTTFGEIVQGMSLGGNYAFDFKSYKKFYSLASKICMPVLSFEEAKKKADKSALRSFISIRNF